MRISMLSWPLNHSCAEECGLLHVVGFDHVVQEARNQHAATFAVPANVSWAFDVLDDGLVSRAAELAPVDGAGAPAGADQRVTTDDQQTVQAAVRHLDD